MGFGASTALWEVIDRRTHRVLGIAEAWDRAMAMKDAKAGRFVPISHAIVRNGTLHVRGGGPGPDPRIPDRSALIVREIVPVKTYRDRSRTRRRR